MVKKLFALASVTALAGFVSAVTASGCTTTAVEVQPGDSGVSDAKKDHVVVEEEEAGKDCKTVVKFAPDTVNPPAPQQADACTEATIKTLADACTEDPGGAKGDECQKAREGGDAATKKCAACIFGSKTDAEWKVINLEPGGSPPARYNQAGCIEHVTQVKGCGKSFSEASDCVDAFCGSCKVKSEFDDCNQSVLDPSASYECKDWGLTGACAAAFTSKKTALSENCFSKSNSMEDHALFFTNMAKDGCMTATKTADAGTDAGDGGK